MQPVLGDVSSPISRASRTFFFIDMPMVAMTRSKSMAASAICCTRWMWLAKQVVMIRLPSDSWKRLNSTLPTDVSDRELPFSHALVESPRKRRTPNWSLSEPMRARSVRRPSTGVRSILKSPLCRMMPCGVWNAVANPWGTEWVTGMNSTSNGPILRRSPSATTLNEVLPSRPASSMRLRARPSVRAEP